LHRGDGEIESWRGIFAANTDGGVADGVAVGNPLGDGESGCICLDGNVGKFIGKKSAAVGLKNHRRSWRSRNDERHAELGEGVHLSRDEEVKCFSISVVVAVSVLPSGFERIEFGDLLWGEVICVAIADVSRHEVGADGLESSEEAMGKKTDLFWVFFEKEGVVGFLQSCSSW
jgi:hypothetical protein